uniref:Uncharacterized protein n=1 Tax=Anguilla anguilla TaxID=7936 RepID=A0A0E9V956_ANGAN
MRCTQPVTESLPPGSDGSWSNQNIDKSSTHETVINGVMSL